MMSIPSVSLIGWLHTAVCVAAVVAGAAALWTRKGSARHRRWGRVYVPTMIAAQLSALLIYRIGGFTMFHWLAVITLLLVALGAFAAPRQASAAWSLTHLSCMVWSYYLLIGGAVNEAFLRLSVLRPVSPFDGGPRHYYEAVHAAVLLFFTACWVVFLATRMRRRRPGHPRWLAPETEA